MSPFVPAAHAQPAKTVLAVTKAADDGTPGTLRWAIEENNRGPGNSRIEIGALTIKPIMLLPPIKGPVAIVGAPGATVDGSALVDTANPRACRGENPEQFGPNVRTLQGPGLAIVDTSDVEIAGLEVRNFCIGILSWRSARSHFHHNRIVNNVGGAGIMFTGDDGAGNPTAGRSVGGRVEFNTLIDNGDGLELTRGTENTSVTNNVFVMTPAALVPSQGIEVLASNNDLIADNTFSGFSDGLQVGGNGHTLRNNTITDAAYGITVSGNNVRIEKNRIAGVRMGIGVRGSGHVLAGNAIADVGRAISRCNAGGVCANNPQYGALKLGIDLGIDGPGAPATANGLQVAPELSSDTLWSGDQLIVFGALAAKPGTTYRVELFASRTAGEGELFLTELSLTTDGAGQARFNAALTAADPLRDGRGEIVLTSTATGPDGTSEFSAGLPVKKER